MRYQWQSDASLIQEVTFTGNGQSTIREAVITIPAHAKDADKLRNLDNLFIDNGYSVSYDIKDNQPIIRVGGFRQPKDVLTFLKQKEVVSGNIQAIKTTKAAPSMWRTIRDNSLVLSAAFYMLGNTATALSGLFRNDMDELKAGVAFSVGDSFMLLFGKTSDKQKQEHVMQGFGEFLGQHGYTPDVGSNFSASAIKNKSHNGFTKAMKSLVIPVKSVSEIFAGYSFAKAGFNQENAYKKVAGTALMTGFSAGLLIPEKNNSQIRDIMGVDTPEQAKLAYKDLSIWQKVKYAVMSKPLILSGGFAAINNFATLFGAFDEKKNARNLRKVEAELGVDKNGSRLSTANSSYEISILNYTKTKQVEKTAYAAHSELEQKVNSASTPESQKEKLKPELLKAASNVKKLEAEYKNATKGRFGLDGSKFWIFNLVQGGLFLVANSLYGMSSKSGSGNQELTDRFVSAASTEIVKQTDPAARNNLITLAAQYASELEEMDFTNAEMRTMIEAHVEQLQASPWVKKYAEPEVAQTPEPEVAVIEMDKERSSPSFAAKVNQQALEAEAAQATASHRV